MSILGIFGTEPEIRKLMLHCRVLATGIQENVSVVRMIFAANISAMALDDVQMCYNDMPVSPYTLTGVDGDCIMPLQ